MSQTYFSPVLRVVLGPTNTGKTHLALERMLAHQSGMIGLPLRLLAREVYDRCLAGDFGAVHRADLALITGEEKIIPPKARYFICTTEAMPISREVEFVAIDECQLAADPERGHVFTDRILHARGTSETLLLGAETMAPILTQLLDKVTIEGRERFSRLSYAGSQKLSRLPRRSAVAAFSANNVYAIAEVMRQQRGGAAVVMGGLSPRTRNAQVEMYQSGEVDFLVATDAIGMGLNMDVDHVAFAQRRKFDGRHHRQLSPAELAQIAGRAGRHKTDGTFGVTGDMDGFDEELVEQIENNQFEPVKALMWRNPNLDFSSTDALLLSLDRPVPRPGLSRAPVAADVQALTILNRDPEVRDLTPDEASVRQLWEVVQIPDFRKTTIGEYSSLIGEIFGFLRCQGAVPETWLAERIERCDRSDGDLDTLAMRLTHIRTWTYIAQRAHWLEDPVHFQDLSRAVEDRLSDALHTKLMGQFVDRKTSALMKRLQGREDISAVVETNGDILVAEEYMGRLNGLRVERDPRLQGSPAGTARAAVEKTVSQTLRQRAQSLVAAADDAFSLSETGELIWQQAVVAHLHFNQDDTHSAQLSYMQPQARLLADEALNGEPRQAAEARLTAWLRQKFATELAPLYALSDSKELDGLVRGLAFQLVEHKGNMIRADIADTLSRLDQPLRRQLRARGVRFGAYNVFLPALLKPAPARLLALIALLETDLKDGAKNAQPTSQQSARVKSTLATLPGPGLTSVTREKISPAIYRACGFYVTPTRAIRFDMLERLADLIRPLLAADTARQGFVANEQMMSIMGCSAEGLAEILTALGYQSHEVAPASEPQASEAETSEPKASEADTSEADTSEAETSEAETPEAEAPEPEAAALSESEAPTLTVMWRPAPVKRGKNTRRKAGAKTGRPAKGKNPQAKNGRGKAQDKKPDMNSPFAVLQSLSLDKQPDKKR
jgi:ATP-dependent RNA helicase SUPV3L1/SUV3